MRYICAICLISAAAIQTTQFVVRQIVASEQSEPPQARELTRVEQVMRAQEAVFIQLPAHDGKIAPSIEPQTVALNLAVEIDNAERLDNPLTASSAPPQALVTASLPDVRLPAKPKPMKESQRLAAIALKKQDPKTADRGPAPAAVADKLDPQVAAAPTLKAAVQAAAPESQPKLEPVRKKLARRDPNAGELIRMQLLNLI